jgi:hypothetical protein
MGGDRFVQVLRFQKLLRLKTTYLCDHRADSSRMVGGILRHALEDHIAALHIGPDVVHTLVLKEQDQVLHGEKMMPSE